MTNVQIVLSTTSYNHHDSQTHILIFNKSLYYGNNLSHSLVKLNKVKHNGLDLWDNSFNKI